MGTPVVLPDGKQMAIELLSAALGDVLVTGKLPEGGSLNAALPAVRLLRVGGISDVAGWADPAHRDNPRLSVDCYADSDHAAMRLAQRVCAEWQLLAGQSTADGIVTRVTQETGPQDRPEEPNTGVARVGMTLGMSVSPPQPIS